jgi:hypothetical protein
MGLRPIAGDQGRRRRIAAVILDDAARHPTESPQSTTYIPPAPSGEPNQREMLSSLTHVGLGRGGPSHAPRELG